MYGHFVPSDQPRRRASSRGRALVLFGVLVWIVGGCAGGTGTAGAGGGPGAGGGWESLREPRPEPLSGAARITVAELAVLGQGRWSGDLPVSPSLGLRELTSLNLLRRRDVRFVERRRFSRALERERSGRERPEGAPPIGRSPGAELVLTGTWAPAGADSAYLDLRLTDAESGQVVRTWRTPTPAEASLPALARAAAGGALEAVDALDRRPEWDDPLRSGDLRPAPPEYRPVDVPPEAVTAFLRGLAAEDRFEWETARREYQRAIEAGGADFFEPEVALARAARLRAGGTLGSS